MRVKYYFRKNTIDFHKWCRLIRKSESLVKNFTHLGSSIRDGLRNDYRESIIIVNQYEVLKTMLDEPELTLLEKYYITNKVPPRELCNYGSFIYSKWIEIMFPNGKGRLKYLDTLKLAENLKRLRIKCNYNKEEIAGLIGVIPSTLRAYENGETLIPIDKLFLLCQIYGLLEDDLIYQYCSKNTENMI